jgi:hypothetical protein
MLNLKRRTVVDVDALLATETAPITITPPYLHERVRLLSGNGVALETSTPVAILERQLAARL